MNEALQLTLAQDVQITGHQNCKRVKSIDRRSARNQSQGTELRRDHDPMSDS